MKKINYKQVFQAILNNTITYLEKNNRKTMVLGISGGIDSTVTAAICSEVHRLKPEYRFIGISLPCSTNSDEERFSAQAAMNAFCNTKDCYEENLQKEYSFLRETFSQCYNKLELAENKVALGNIKARLRMMYLYNIAALRDGLVIDTDNLTEHYLGFFTIHGDVGDFNPIGGLWKHEVYGLAKWLANEYYQGWPEQISTSEKIQALRTACNITPTDGNGVKVGGDLAQIAPGLTYDQVDEILIWFLNPKTNYKWYYNTHNFEDFPSHVKNEFNKMYNKYGCESVNMVIKRHINSEFKRKRLPIAIEREEYKDYITPKFEN